MSTVCCPFSICKPVLYPQNFEYLQYMFKSITFWGYHFAISQISFYSCFESTKVKTMDFCSTVDIKSGTRNLWEREIRLNLTIDRHLFQFREANYALAMPKKWKAVVFNITTTASNLGCLLQFTADVKGLKWWSYWLMFAPCDYSVGPCPHSFSENS